MPTISIVTPWAGNTAALIPEYAAAVQGCEVVTVDNASSPETAAALKAAGGVYLRNETNAGFAGGNNIGYAKASGDIIIFLNSDVAPAGNWLASVVADVRDGALYGPAMAVQLVAGRWLTYLEGWCIAATRATWERLTAEMNGRLEIVGGAFEAIGPWDSFNYPGPYWEDNDLCLRALQEGIALIQTTWPIRHLGGRTAGPLIGHAASFERNRETFSARVRATLPPAQQPTPAYQRFLRETATQSDIQHHLPLLYSYAQGHIVELGTRSGVSTAAFLAGVEARGGEVISVDIDDCAHLYAGHPLWTFVQSDSRDINTIARAIGQQVMLVDGIDVLFIDTEHTYEMAEAELRAWAEYVKPGGVILMHDPETFPGVRRAAQEFADAHGWPITFVLPCNGMAIITRPAEGVSVEGAAWAMEAA